MRVCLALADNVQNSVIILQNDLFVISFVLSFTQIYPTYTRTHFELYPQHQPKCHDVILL